MPAETSLDDASYDAQAAGSGGIIDGAAGGEEPPAEEGSAGGPPGQPEAAGEGSNCQPEPEQHQQQVAKTRKRNKTQFDRLVSSVFEGAGGSEGKLGRGAGGASRAGGGSARWHQKLSGSYLRRAVSARFAGTVARAAEEGGGEQGGGAAAKAALPAGKSGARRQRMAAPGHLVLPALLLALVEHTAVLASMPLRCNQIHMPALPCPAGRLIVTEDQAVGSVPWSIYGRYAARMGLPVVFLIAGEQALGTAAASWPVWA